MGLMEVAGFVVIAPIFVALAMLALIGATMRVEVMAELKFWWWRRELRRDDRRLTRTAHRGHPPP